VRLNRCTVRNMVLAAVASIAGCQDKNKDAIAPQANEDGPITPADYRALGEFPHLCLDRPSAYDILNPDDLRHFQEGVELTLIMEEIKWRGNFAYATIIDNKAVAALEFRYSVADPEGLHGPNIIAIFDDYKFSKFTSCPSRSKDSLRLFSELREALAAPAVSPIDIWNEYTISYKRLAKSAASEPGIEMQSMILGPMLQAFMRKSGKDSASFVDYKRNAELRDQFNAARLRLGMTSREIKAVLKCDQPLEIGQIDGMKYEIYGSGVDFGKISSYISYQNVLIIFDDKEAIGIYGIPGGSQGVDAMHEAYPNLRRIK
jgi:hypothetical protein